MFDYFYGQSGEMFSYFRVPKILFRDIRFKDLSTDAKTLYGILLDRMGLSVKNGWLDEQGRVYIIFPVQEVMDALGCADNKATKLFRELEKFGLIERKRRGLGKPNLIYVKNFADPRFRNREKNGSGAADSAQPEAAKSRGNKTEWNKTEGSEPDPFPSDAEGEPDERTRLEAYFMQSLEVDLLLRVCPDEEDTIDQIVNLLVDTCSSKRRMLRVAGDDKPAEVVRSRFMKLNADHIRFVLKCLAESTAPVRNMKQYLLAALYNAPTTMQLYYEIISGHRRQHAAELAGLDTLPVIVREMDDDAAILLMVDSNLQRESILPSERAFAYKMKLDAMKRTSGRPSKENVSQIGTQKRSDQIMAEELGESRNQIQRFIRLTNLIPELLDLVDEKKISFNPAVELSYLDEAQQRDFLQAMDETQNAPSLSQAQRMKKLAQEGKFTYEAAFAIMGEAKKDELDKVVIKNDTLKKYFPRSYTPRQMEDVIIKLLEQWQRRQQRQNER